MRGRWALGSGLALLLLAACSAQAATCTSTVKADQFASSAQLRQLNAKEAGFGARPTASANQDEFIHWIEREVKDVRGVKTKSLGYDVDRWDSRSASLAVAGSDIPLAGPIPYSAAAPAGVTAPVSYVAAGESINAANAAGRIVVVEDALETYPASVFYPGALGIDGYTPRGLEPDEPYSRDSRNEAAYLRAAQAAGAVGLIIAKDLPRDQIAGFYRPYNGTHWSLPGAFVGADEGARLKDAAAAGQSATLTAQSAFTPATTRTLMATLPGPGKGRFVVESHTDGMNAVWDNGPVAMIAMLAYLAELPKRCRPATVQFAFTTGHLYGGLGAGALAAQLDSEYDGGKVLGVMALEHLGARELATVPRAQGPGSELQLTHRHEPTIVAVTQSTPLRSLVAKELTKFKLDRTVLVTGTDPPVTGRVPENCSFGGEGTPYERSLVPTIGVISGPRELFTPGYGIETIDFKYLRTQTLTFTDLLLGIGELSRAEIAGDLLAMRDSRAAGAPGCATSEGRRTPRYSFHCGIQLPAGTSAGSPIFASTRTNG